jgi:hypothetical protein
VGNTTNRSPSPKDQSCGGIRAGEWVDIEGKNRLFFCVPCERRNRKELRQGEFKKIISKSQGSPLKKCL